MNRRQLLAAALAAPLASLAVPRVMAAAAATAPPSNPRRLLLVELNGGNDGLNTVVPGKDPLYARLRPGLALDDAALLPLSDGMGFNPALAGLHEVWDRGELAVVQGVGYAHANRSHFRSIEIWDTATDADVTGTHGWLSSVDLGAPGIVIGRNPAPLEGGKQPPVVMSDSERFAAQARGVDPMAAAGGNAALRHILAVQGEIRTAGATLGAGRPRPAGDFPPGPFGRDAAEAAALLSGDPASRVVKIALTGFDTHVNQRQRHDALLGQLGRGLAALRTAFIEAGVWNDVLIMTYSEFGRRAGQNASGGTDHGKAAPHLLLGGAVRGGLYGSAPRLDALDEGDVPATTDFRCVYNTVLTRWWSDAGAAIDVRRFPALAVV